MGMIIDYNINNQNNLINREYFIVTKYLNVSFNASMTKIAPSDKIKKDI